MSKKLLIPVILVMSTFCSSFAADIMQQIFDSGMVFYKNGEFKSAADNFGQVVDMQKDNHQARYYYVMSLIYTGNKREALDNLNHLLAAYPQNESYKALAAQLKAELAPPPAPKPQEAQKKTTSAPKPKVIAEPRQETEIEQASKLIDDENYKEAKTLLEKFLKKNSGNCDANKYLGIIDMNQGRYETSAKYFERAFKNGLKDFDSFFMAASVYANLQRPNEAIKHLKSALKIKEDTFAELYLADMYCKKSDYSSAEAAYKKILKKDPEIIDAEVGLVQIKLDEGYVDDASVLINNILNKATDNPKARFIKAKILLASKKYSESAEEAAAASADNPNNVEYKVIKLLADIRNFQIQPSIAELESIIKAHPSNEYAYEVLAEGLVTAGETDKAKTVLSDAEKKFKSSKISYLKGLLLALDGNYTEAEKYYIEYRKRAGSNPESLLEYAKFKELYGTQADMISAYKKVSGSFPGTPFAKYAEAAIERIKKTVFVDYGGRKRVIPD